MTQDSVIGWIPIVGTVGGELANITINLVEQRLNLGWVAGVLICQAMRNDLATVGIQHKM